MVVMNKQRSFLLLLFVCFFISSFIFAGDTKAKILQVIDKDGITYAGKGWATEFNGLKIVYYSGSPEEIGQQQALLVMKPGGEKLNQVYYELQQEMATGNKYLDAFRNFYARYKFIPAFKRHIPEEYLSELRGMALALSGGKSDNYDDFILANAAQDLGLVMGCSIVAAWGEMTESGGLLVGRNLDHQGFARFTEYQYLAFYNPEQGNRFVALNYPSYVGLMQGMNEKGLVIGMTYSMVEETETSIDGLPYTIMLRQVLQYADNLEEAINIIKETPRTVGLNILLAGFSDQQAVVVETSANRFFVREAEDYIYATNRFRSSYMQSYQAGGWLASNLREQRFDEIKEIYKGKLDYKLIVEILRDKFAPESLAARGYVSGIENIATMASLVFRPASLQVFISNRTEVPVPEGAYLGFDCRQIWETGQPVQPFEIIPASPQTAYNQCWLKVREAELAASYGDHERVKELLEPIIQVEPEAEKPLLLLGISYLKSNEIDRGLELLNRLVGKSEIAEPYHLLEAYFWLGAINDIVKKDRTKALGYYRKALEVEIPDMPGNTGYYKEMVKAGLSSPLVIDDGRITSN